MLVIKRCFVMVVIRYLYSYYLIVLEEGKFFIVK